MKADEELSPSEREVKLQERVSMASLVVTALFKEFVKGDTIVLPMSYFEKPAEAFKIALDEEAGTVTVTMLDKWRPKLKLVIA